MPLPGEVLDQFLGVIALDLDGAVAQCTAGSDELLQIFQRSLGVAGQPRDEGDPAVAAAAAAPLDAHDAVAWVPLRRARPRSRTAALALAGATQIAVFGRVHPCHAVIMQR